MLQVQVLRANPTWVKERLAVKNFKQVELVDEIVSLDDERKRTQLEFDTVQSKINASSKEIGKLMGQGKKEEADAIKEQVSSYKVQVGQFNERLAVIEKELHDMLVLLPNLPGEQVPLGHSADDNEVVREFGERQKNA